MYSIPHEGAPTTCTTLIEHRTTTFQPHKLVLRTDTQLAVGDAGRPRVSAEVGVAVWPAADWIDEVIAVVGRVGKVPVLSIACIPGSLERESQHSRVVVQRWIHDVLCRVGDWFRVPT